MTTTTRSSASRPVAARAAALWLCLLALFVTSSWASELRYRGPELVASYEGPVVVANSQAAYTSRDKLTFFTAAYLEQRAPNLLELRPAIDSWAARVGLHPRILASLVQGVFAGTSPIPSRDNFDIVADLAVGFAEILEQERAQAGAPVLAASRAYEAVRSAYGIRDLAPFEYAQERQVVRMAGGGPPLFGYFQPPWEIGDTWAGGGAHGDTGTGTRNALDFWGAFRNWGEDLSAWWVAAAQSGTARVWSSCSMTVIHPNGWETSYYHLDNIQVTDMQQVGRNHRLSNYANTEAQALCNGGSSTGPHVHVALRFDGQRVEVDETQVDFTSFSHHVGVGQYDSDCSRSYYTRAAGGTVCPFWDQLLNDAPSAADQLFADGFESGSASAWSAP